MRIPFVFALLELRRSYWFLPTIFALVALVLGIAMPRIDAAVGEVLTRDTWVVAMGPTSARAALTMIASAILGVAGVAFSITLVAVSFAGANYGPRIIGNFMTDRINQVVLAIFVGTFVFAMMAVRAVHAGVGDLDPIVPQFTIIVAMALAVISIGALIIFIHHVPESINVMNIVGAIGADLKHSILALYDDEDSGAAREEASVAAARHLAGEGAHVRADAPGYVQFVVLDDLRAIARDTGAQIVLLAAPGDFVTEDDLLLEIVGGVPDEAVAHRGRKAFTLGKTRSAVQDVLFLADQLVEIIGRALSPSLNDPYTAILCIDWLRAGLSSFAERPALVTPGRDGLVIFRRLTFEEVTGRVFERIRQYATADRTVTLAAIDALADLGCRLHATRQPALIVALIEAYARSAHEQLGESLAREEVDRAVAAAKHAIEEGAGATSR